MRRALALLLLIVLSCPPLAHAAIKLESRAGAESAEMRVLVTRLEDVLVRTEKRIREVFAVRIDVKAVVETSKEDYDLLYKQPEDTKKAGVLLINSRVIRDRPIEDLKIAAARALYQAVWPRYRKPTASAPVMVQRMFAEGMTAYAAELMYPGASPWKYAGLFGSEGKEQYRQYLSREKDLAQEALQALSARQERGFDPRTSIGRLLSYRLMKTFEMIMDRKMIQLMQIAEFEQRLPAGLGVLKQGFRGKGWMFTGPRALCPPPR